ncbi:MAG: hypothetical protein HPY59_07400 [Anaerolineae bacterium]|nr:hypothetical protein [Anaerolineae bacterium]
MNKLKSYLASIAVLLLFIAIVSTITLALSETILFDIRDIDGKVAKASLNKISEQVPGLSTMEMDFIGTKLSACLLSRKSIGSVLPKSRALVGFAGLTENELSGVVTAVSKSCLQKYVLESATVEEMNSRNRMLGPIAPYSVDELAVLSDGRS